VTREERVGLLPTSSMTGVPTIAKENRSLKITSRKHSRRQVMQQVATKPRTRPAMATTTATLLPQALVCRKVCGTWRRVPRIRWGFATRMEAATPEIVNGIAPACF